MQTIVMIGFNEIKIESILTSVSNIKLVIFDEDDKFRENFESFHKIYNDRITFYEGCISANLIGYINARKEEGVDPLSFISTDGDTLLNTLLSSCKCTINNK